MKPFGKLRRNVESDRTFLHAVRGMRGAAPDYKVIDRSILLPYYRRYLVDPLLPLVPARLSPNVITHAGHLINLLSISALILFWPRSGMLLALAALGLNVYLWCDNADGAHARRTRQCSTAGEYLDHGLDLLNTVYIAYYIAYVVQASGLWWVAMAVLMPGAAAASYWEQAATGTFRLGRLNQIEGVATLTFSMLLATFYSTAIFQDIQILGVTLGTWLVGWAASTIVFGTLMNMARVAKAAGQWSVVMPCAVHMTFGGLIVIAVYTDALHPIAGVALATGVNLFYGMRMLWTRLQRKQPRLEPLMISGAAFLFVFVAWHQVGAEPAIVGTIAAIAGVFIFAGQTLLDARNGIQRILRPEHAPRVA